MSSGWEKGTICSSKNSWGEPLFTQIEKNLFELFRLRVVGHFPLPVRECRQYGVEVRQMPREKSWQKTNGFFLAGCQTWFFFVWTRCRTFARIGSLLVLHTVLFTHGPASWASESTSQERGREREERREKRGGEGRSGRGRGETKRKKRQGRAHNQTYRERKRTQAYSLVFNMQDTLEPGIETFLIPKMYSICGTCWYLKTIYSEVKLVFTLNMWLA